MWTKYLADSIPKVRIKSSCGEDNLREASCGSDSAIEENATANIANSMKCFTPPLVTRDAESGNRRSWVNELREFLVQCESGNKVSGSLGDGKLWVAEWVGSGGWIWRVTSKWRELSEGEGGSESEEKEDDGDKGKGRRWEGHSVQWGCESCIIELKIVLVIERED